MPNIEINNEFKQALNLVENSRCNLLICGKAGTGKSTFLHYCRTHSKKKIVVLAPTGVAAINISGMTIHSFFGFSIDITTEKIKKVGKKSKAKKVLKSIDAIIIDEISMVRADLLDCVEKFLTLNGPYPNQPFGGLQMIFIGDLYQIPPVVTKDVEHFFTDFYQSPYFFSAQAFTKYHTTFTFLEFAKIYRQTEQHFVELLNAIRNKTITAKQLQAINQRWQPDFQAPEDEYWVYLTGTNHAVKQINDRMLNNLQEKEWIYLAKIQGNIRPSAFPTDQELKLKIGAQVMMVNNDSQGRWVNGSIGHIINFAHDRENNLNIIMIQLANKTIVDVHPHSWDVFKHRFPQGLNRQKAP